MKVSLSLKLSLPVVALSISLLGCSNGPEYGIVKDKSVTPGYTYIQQQCTSYNSKGMCISYVPIIIYVPTYWYLTLENDAESGERAVSKGMWDSCTPGNSYRNERCYE